MVKRATDPDRVGLSSSCNCPEYLRLNGCIHINLVERLFLDVSSPWLASLPAEGALGGFKTDFRVDQTNGRVFDTIDCSVLNETDGTGRSIIITENYILDDFPARAFGISVVVHSPYHGDWSTVTGV